MLEVVARYLKDMSVLRRLLFAAASLPLDLPNLWGIAVEFATAGKVERNAIDAMTAKSLIENIETFDKCALKKDDCLLKELVGWLPTSAKKPLGIILISDKKACVLCKKDLVIRKDRPSYITICDNHIGSAPGTHFHKICSSKACSVTQYYGYYSTGGDKSQVYYDSDWATNDYFVSSSLTAYSMSLIREIDSQVVIGQLSYKQIADIFNHVHSVQQIYTTGELSELVDRYQMDRRRLEDAHFQFAILQVASWYPHHMNVATLALHSSTKSTILDVVATYHGIFMAQYSQHRCDNKGCGNILILDGNMKNHRDVCLAREAGYAEFSGLPGKVKTGCPNTPQPKSRYCSYHTPTAFTPEGGSGSNADTVKESTSKPDEQLAFISAKKITKVTRIGFSSSVTTWEPASCLPPSIVSDFESGVQRDVDENVFSSGGQTLHTLCSQTTSSPVKRSRLDSSSQHHPGCFEGTNDNGLPLTCNTLKDKVKLNYCTAGILAGMWPCGKITMIGELFGSESLSQVYGFLHTFVFENQDKLKDMSVICYDDGCHLKRYVEKRKDLTKTTEKLASCHIVVDKMHFRGHVDKWCQENCNPYKLQHLNDVDTEVCEQTFSWLSRFSRITRHMNRQHFLFYILYICDLRNQMKLTVVILHKHIVPH